MFSITCAEVLDHTLLLCLFPAELRLFPAEVLDHTLCVPHLLITPEKHHSNKMIR